MISELNPVEVEIIFAILQQHCLKLVGNLSPKQLNLSVASRELTGVGEYINFSPERENILPMGTTADFGFDGEITVPGAPSGLGSVLAVENGRIVYLELFTYGDEK